MYVKKGTGGESHRADAAQRVVASAVSAMLALSMMPVAAFAGTSEAQADMVRDASTIAEQTMRAVRAASIDAQPRAYEAGEILVAYRAGAGGEEPQVPETLRGAEAESVTGGMAGAQVPAIARVELPAGLSVGQAVVAAEDDPKVAYAQPNWRYVPLETPAGASALSPAELTSMAVAVTDPFANVMANDAKVENQWWLHSVRAPEAWEYAKAGAPSSGDPVTIAVLDTGINFEHEDLKNNILSEYAWDAVAEEKLEDSPDTSSLAHGSHVAGIAAAEANNGKGIAGASYNAKILPIAVFSLSGTGQASCSDEDLIKAYDYLLAEGDDGKSVAEKTNLRVVNMSLGGYGGMDEAFRDYIVAAQDAGVLTCAAGGNGDDQGNPLTAHSYPSDYDEVMSVVALKSDTERTYWSDYNESKDIAAPGADIWSTWYTGNDYRALSGTSMATPLVAGCAALMWAYNPDLSVQEVKDALYGTAVDLGEPGRDDLYGHGRIDIAAAIESLDAAHITAERQTMGRTSSQQLEAREVKKPDAVHTWEWSVSDGDLASITQDGKLTAKKAGSVIVRVEDPDDPDMSGKLSITITEITVPGGLSVESDGVNHRMVLRWSAADGAVSYDVLRSTSRTGTFEKIDGVSANGESSFVYEDTKETGVEVAREYFYKVRPIGKLGTEEVQGAETAPVRGYFTDKTSLSEAISAAEELVSGAAISVDGREYDRSTRWTTQSALDALESELSKARTAFAGQNTRQVVVDAATAKLARASAAFEATMRPGAKPVALAQGDVAVAKATYTGKALKPKVTVVHDGETLVQGTDYTLSGWKGNVKAGTGQVTVTGIGLYEGAVTASFTVDRAANPMSVKGKTATVSLKKAKRGKQAVKAAIVFSFTKKAQGKVTYAKAKGTTSKLSIDKKTGAITVPKTAKAATYTMKVQLSAAGDGNYKPGSTTVTVTVKVK